MAKALSSCETSKQLFFSYCHSDKEIVHQILDELEKLNYKIWIDKDLIQGNILFADIQNGIEISHVFISFISKKYCESKNCMVEITYAYNQNKKILPIMLDNYFKIEKEGIKLMISRINSFYAFKKPETFSPWSIDHFVKLNEAIFQLLSEICQSCSKKVLNQKIHENQKPKGIDRIKILSDWLDGKFSKS